MRRFILVGLALAYGLTAMSDEPKPKPTATLPPYKRLLTDADAKIAEELEKRSEEAEKADDFDKAIALRGELLALRIKAQGADHWEAIDVKWELITTRKVAALPADQRAGWRKADQGVNEARELEAKGEYAKAQPLRQKSLDRYRELFSDRHPNTAICYGNLAANLNAQGKCADAHLLFQKSLDLYRELLGDKHPNTATIYNNLALNLTAQGRYADAEPLLQMALGLRQELHGDKHPNTASSYNNLAGNLNAQGKCAEAQLLYHKALDLYLDLFGDAHPNTATIYNNLALNLDAQRKYAEAQPLYQKALDIRRSRLGDKHPFTAQSYNNLALNLNVQWKYTEAQPLYQKALDIRRSRFGDKHPDTALSYSNMAGNLYSQGKYAEAHPLFQKALDLNRDLLGDTHPNSAKSFLVLAYSLHAQRKYAEAQGQLTEAATAYEVARLGVASRGLDRAVFGATRSPYRLQATTLAHLHSPVAAWVAAENDLARGLSDETATYKGLTLTLDEQNHRINLTDRLAQIQPRLLQLVSKATLTDPEKEELAKLQVDRRAIETELSGLASRLSRRQLASLPGVQAALSSDAAVVLWVDLPNQGDLLEHWGCVVRRDGEPAWEQLPGSSPKQTWTNADSVLPSKLREALASGSATAAELANLADQLHAQRLAPLSRHLGGVKTIYVIAVNEMAGIPVEALTCEYTISYLPSGTFLAQLQSRVPPSSSALMALGDPDFSRPEAKPKAARGGNWKDLPGTRSEVAQIAKLFGPSSTTLLDSEASEQSLDTLRKKGELSKFRFLHFATHGEANNIRTLESVLILAQDKLPETPLPRVGEPLINGQLSAREVLEFWDLNAELVTLSACETAIGRQGGGDGLLGFAQAFLTRGSRAVCLSLWKVDDTATALLMIRFYQNLLGKRPGLTGPMPKALALAEAKRWLREISAEEALKLTAAATNGVVRGNRGKGEKLKPVVPVMDPTQPGAKEIKPFADPRYWAAFILIGDPN